MKWMKIIIITLVMASLSFLKVGGLYTNWKLTMAFFIGMCVPYLLALVIVNFAYDMVVKYKKKKQCHK